MLMARVFVFFFWKNVTWNSNLINEYSNDLLTLAEDESINLSLPKVIFHPSIVIL